MRTFHFLFFCVAKRIKTNGKLKTSVFVYFLDLSNANILFSFLQKTISKWKKWSPGEAGPGGRISGSVCGLDPKYVIITIQIASILIFF